MSNLDDFQPSSLIPSASCPEHGTIQITPGRNSNGIAFCPSCGDKLQVEYPAGPSDEDRAAATAELEKMLADSHSCRSSLASIIHGWKSHFHEDMESDREESDITVKFAKFMAIAGWLTPQENLATGGIRWRHTDLAAKAHQRHPTYPGKNPGFTVW